MAISRKADDRRGSPSGKSRVAATKKSTTRQGRRAGRASSPASAPRKDIRRPSTDLAAWHRAAQADLATPAWRTRLRRQLLSWYDVHARDLPWRRSRDPYRIWVSEVMLQQTVVAAVVPYFERFLSRLPTIHDLAAAPEEEVLRLWEGLGYYRRARQLHRAAAVLRDQHAGQFPRDIQSVRRLPGIGRYTAGAILSIAFDQPHPILEANTIRLLARLLAFDGDTASAAGQRLLWGAAEKLVPQRSAGRFNQALMELGSQVCTPRNPRCDECPLAALCPTRRWGLAEAIPAARPKPTIEQISEAAVVVRRGRRVLLVKRQPGERWAGMWDFPRFPLASAEAIEVAQILRDEVLHRTGWQIEPGRRLTSIRHAVTRFRIMLDCYEATAIAAPKLRADRPELCWVPPTRLAEYPLSTSARRLARLLASESASANPAAQG